MDDFDLDIFGRVGNDYEAVHTIRDDIARDLGRRVSDEDVGAALLRLTSAGLVDAFVFDESTKSFRLVDPYKVVTAELWFNMNAHGRAEYERSAA